MDHHLRGIYAQIGGIDLCVTEFVRISQTRLPQKVFKKMCPELLTPIDVPVRVQLLGSDPALLAANARKVAKMGAPAVDLNFGCPAKTVNKNRGGACLLDETELVFDIVKAVRDAVPVDVPVTAKIRLGYDDRSSYLRNALAIEQAGADELAVHARSKKDGYKPPAFWGYIGNIRQQLNIPVIANGEIWNYSDFLRCKEQSRCDDFMLGRGLLAQPDLALEIKARSKGEDYSPMTWQGILPLLYQFHTSTAACYAPKHCGNRLKQWLMYLKRNYPEAEAFFDGIKSTRDNSAILNAFYQQGLTALPSAVNA